MVEKQEWLETFVPEDKDSKHFPGSHWDPFFEGGSEELMATIGKYLESSRKVHAYSDLVPAPEKVPDDWPSAFYHAWPNQQGGLKFVISRQDDVNKVEALFPFAMKGVQHSIIINKVVVFGNGVEAQIECSVQDATITFYDILYATNRAWYKKERMYQFMLTGFAYECRPAKNEPIVLDPPPKWVKDLRIKGGPGNDGKGPDDPMVMHVDGMASFLQIEEWDRDDYSFHGSVKGIQETEIINQPAWLFQTTVIRDMETDADLDIDILVTKRVWGDKPLPKIGEDIEGTLWLQGYLWHPGPEEEE